MMLGKSQDDPMSIKGKAQGCELSPLPPLQSVVPCSICCARSTIHSATGLGGEGFSRAPHSTQGQPRVMGQGVLETCKEGLETPSIRS